MKRPLLLIAALGVAPAATGDTPTPATVVAAPRIIMFYGGVLEGRRYMTTFEENLRFIGAIAEQATLTRDGVVDRPFIEVALYWHNPTWEPYATDPALLQTLRPEAAQPARLYLGDGGHSPIFDYFSAGAHPGLRTIAPAGLEILRRHNVPVHVDANGR
jgi:hypothetical protein